MVMQRIRKSDDLPDDVGVVFITNVPGSWLQLYGRRAYGELWVGGSMVQPEGQEAPSAALKADGIDVDVLSGPEAEALVKLYDETYGERLWRDVLAAGVKPAFRRSAQTEES
jgi:hypothetical protein